MTSPITSRVDAQHVIEAVEAALGAAGFHSAREGVRIRAVLNQLTLLYPEDYRVLDERRLGSILAALARHGVIERVSRRPARYRTLR